ncbi:lipoprotein-anchoring transpeptidase ErfK/SrfK [Nocardia pseudobrasiliensis]|uniref:Lipoprotein-anchoring transpeptidase ErfK/SrfK n=1 Tax=Nocardia pseudobrasiliensis TaxID=45979 RepID=A0A370HSK6_9NOCA|nr:lipoprotein-anchoring transpeptidase ErfK/SrfK [Nocardia pseudobrasiliensis]
MRTTTWKPARNSTSRPARIGVLSLAVTSLAVATAAAISVAPASAAPLWPGGPDVPGAPAVVQAPQPAPGAAPMKNPPPLPQANFAPPSVSPSDGDVVGVAQPIIINFKEPVADHDAAEKAIRITSSNATNGHFYWRGDKQVRWRPEELWPANSDITVEAGGTKVAYKIGDEIKSVADDATHTVTVTRNGEVIKTMPTSMGKAKHETPNGTYYVGEKNRKMIMDSSTYGVPTTDPEGYKLEVEWATRLSNSGIFVHSAPWSVAQQGVSDTSHGCLNVSPADAQWFFENSQKGDPVIVQNSTGTFSTSDGMGDWN